MGARAKAVEKTGTGARADMPLYLQVARTLKDEIVSGGFPVGAQLPTEDELTTRFDVSRYTVREALRRLREDGLVASRQGAGTVVIPPRASDAYVHHVVPIKDLVEFVADTSFAIESIGMVTIDAKLAARTTLPIGQEWLEVRGLRSTDEAPACWTEYYIHREFAAVGRLLQRHTGPIFSLIEDLYGQSILEVHQEISATLLSPALADRLEVKAGSAALEVRRSYRTTEGQLAQVTLNTLPATRFSYSMTMQRMKT